MYTVDETGMMNNYAIEPASYLAESPSPEQQRQYVLQGAVALVLVTLSILTAVAVS